MKLKMEWILSKNVFKYVLAANCRLRADELEGIFSIKYRFLFLDMIKLIIIRKKIFNQSKQLWGKIKIRILKVSVYLLFNSFSGNM